MSEAVLSAPMVISTREEWLIRCMGILIEKVFRPANLQVPATVRVSCGWPIGTPGLILGQCFDKIHSKDELHEIFIAPILDDAVAVADTLTHELLHVVVGVDKKHGKAFTDAGKRLGMEGKPKSMGAGPVLRERLRGYIEELGPYPHAGMVPKKKETKQKATRKKLQCDNLNGAMGDACDYQVWTSPKYLEKGLPVCPCGGILKVVDPDPPEVKEVEIKKGGA